MVNENIFLWRGKRRKIFKGGKCFFRGIENREGKYLFAEEKKNGDGKEQNIWRKTEREKEENIMEKEKLLRTNE